MIIYKITNKINNKVYIGLTKCTLQYRWTKHIGECNNVKNSKQLYKAMRKYGIENFTIEKIDHTDNFEKLGELERFYIKQYNSQNPKYGYNLTAGGERNQWDANPSSKLTYDDIVKIRTIYAEGILSKQECWSQYYKDKISFKGFEKIWCGISWQNILPEVYTKDNINLHKNFRRNCGPKNGNTKSTDYNVLEIRKYYVNHTLKETYLKYGKNYKNIDTFRQVLTRTFSHIPIYKKQQNIWILNNKIIDINNYKPVSTISVSGE